MTPSQTPQQIQSLREAGHVHTAQALTDLYLAESRPVYNVPRTLREVPPRDSRQILADYYQRNGLTGSL
jgi:hypothetical protein